MTDTELRALVRDAVARHLGRSDRADVDVLDPAFPILTEPVPAPAQARHASHAQYFTLINIGDDCVIEPSVKCNHCGYCKSHGH